MVKRSIDQKLRLRNFDARHVKIETGAVVKTHKGLSGVERGKNSLLPVERKKAVFEGRPMQFPAWDPLHRSAEIENLNENDDEELQSDELQGVPDWPQEFKPGLVDVSVPEHRDTSSSSHELLVEPRAKVEAG